MAALTDLAGLFPDEICAATGLSPAFRGKQVFQWIGRGAASFDEMTNLDKASRAALAAQARIYSSAVTQTLKDPDGTVKLQLTLDDGCAVETVLLCDREGRKTACVSCQAGCAMRCAFCQTGQLGLQRNLSAGEIIEEFLHLEGAAGTLDNIVFMGMGEPLQNIAAIRKAVAILTDKAGRALSSRRITLSTCGLIEGIYALAEQGPLLRLAVSLTTASQELREKLMPIAKANPLPELKKAITYYSEKSGKRVTLEAALLAGQNTDRESAMQLISFARGLNVHLNLIPWNPVPGLPFETPSAAECRNFVSLLEQAGLKVTLRMRRGVTIGGACGQLGRTAQNLLSFVSDFVKLST